MARHIVILILTLLVFQYSQSSSPGNKKADDPHSRQKRLLWITNDGRIALPPGTTLTITPTLSLPFVRHPPHGFLSNMTISLPFNVDFDKLGLTDNENPYGAIPPIFDRSMKSRQAGMMMADFIASFINRRLHKRELQEAPPKNAFHGGERALLYGTVEDMLNTMGLDGKACLLRAICEVHGHSLNNFGLVGEMLRLFFTASKSPFANLLAEYVDAENRGKEHGECWPYFKNCPKSLFLPAENRYTQEMHVNNFESVISDERNDVFASKEEHEDHRRNKKGIAESSM